MDFNNIDELKSAGFTGFRKMSELFSDSSSLPKIRGVYLVLNTGGKREFLEVGTGGYFKGRDPNVTISELRANWVDNTILLYIGKAGKEGSGATLRSRIRQYLSFGKSGNVGHWGGRLIWQLENSKDLIICWKALPDNDPRTIEIDLIKLFVSKFSIRPFANLAD